MTTTIVLPFRRSSESVSRRPARSRAAVSTTRVRGRQVLKRLATAPCVRPSPSEQVLKDIPHADRFRPF